MLSSDMSDISVNWSLGMICAKNYEKTFKFVKFVKVTHHCFYIIIEANQL